MASANGASVAGDSVPDETVTVDDDRGGQLVEMLAYLGGALVLAAVCVIAAMSWDSFSRGGKVGFSASRVSAAVHTGISAYLGDLVA
jgi:uncharacterized membrane protein